MRLHPDRPVGGLHEAHPAILLDPVGPPRIAWAAPVSDVTTFTLEADRDYTDDQQGQLDELEKLASRKRAAEAAVTAYTARITDLGAKIRRNFVRYKASLDADLPADLEDVAIDKTKADETTLHWHTAAATFREPPPE